MIVVMVMMIVAMVMMSLDDYVGDPGNQQHPGMARRARPRRRQRGMSALVR